MIIHMLQIKPPGEIGITIFRIILSDYFSFCNEHCLLSPTQMILFERALMFYLFIYLFSLPVCLKVMEQISGD